MITILLSNWMDIGFEPSYYTNHSNALCSVKPTKETSDNVWKS